MATKFRLVFSLLLAISGAEMEWNTNDYLKREHSLVKPYQGSGFGITNWDFLGNTIVTSQNIRLTPNLQSQSGAIWNTQVLTEAKMIFDTTYRKIRAAIDYYASLKLNK